MQKQVPREHYLDVCDMVPGFDETNEYDRHPMTLLAFAGYYGRKKVMDYLINNGARKCLLIKLWQNIPSVWFCNIFYYAVTFLCLDHFQVYQCNTMLVSKF